MVGENNAKVSSRCEMRDGTTRTREDGRRREGKGRGAEVGGKIAADCCARGRDLAGAAEFPAGDDFAWAPASKRSSQPERW